MKSASNLEKVLEAGHFAVTAEVGPPQSADGDEVREKAEILSGNIDACNVTEKSRKIWLSHNWRVEYKVFKTPKEECIRRAIDGGRHDLIEVIERMSSYFEAPA